MKKAKPKTVMTVRLDEIDIKISNKYIKKYKCSRAKVLRTSLRLTEKYIGEKLHEALENS